MEKYQKKIEKANVFFIFLTISYKFAHLSLNFMISESRKKLENFTKEELETLIPTFSSIRSMFKSLNIKYRKTHTDNFLSIKKKLLIKACFFDKTSHPNLKKNIFKTINTKEKAYWLGFIAADGYIPHSSNKLAFTMSTKDEEHFDKLLDFIGANKNKKRYFHGNSNNAMLQIDISDKLFSSNIKKHGIVSPKSKSLRLPHLKTNQLTRSFILGLFDGDGTTTKTSSTPILYSGSEELLKDIQWFFKTNYKISNKENKWGSVSALCLCLYNISLSQKENKKYNLKRKNIRPRSKKTKRIARPETFVRVTKINELTENQISEGGNLKGTVRLKCFTYAKSKRPSISKNQLITDLKENKNITKIGKKYNISPNAIIKKLKKLKINYKPYLIKKTNYNKKKDSHIISYYEKVKTIEATAKFFHIDPLVIKRVIKNSPVYKEKIAHKKEIEQLKLKVRELKLKHTFTEVATILNITRVRAKSLYYQKHNLNTK